MSHSKSSPISRRTVFAGAGAVGALGAVALASKLPGVAPEARPLAAAATPVSGGYQLTEHVKQYYASARI
jgi:hypothetical protein